jgi:hypothetical protein
MAVHVFLFLLVLCLLCLALFWRLGWLYRQPSPTKTGAQRIPVQRLLKPRSPDDCPACRLASTPSTAVRPASAEVAPLVGGEKPSGSPQTHRHRGLRLSKPAVPVLRDHRCTHSCARRRWQAWACREHPNVSLPGLPYHVHFQAQHAPLPAENALSASRHGALYAGRRTGPILYWLLGSSIQKQALREGERSTLPTCKPRRGGVQSEVVTRILMLERHYAHVMEKLLVWLVF